MSYSRTGTGGSDRRCPDDIAAGEPTRSDDPGTLCDNCGRGLARCFLACFNLKKKKKKEGGQALS